MAVSLNLARWMATPFRAGTNPRVGCRSHGVRSVVSVAVRADTFLGRVEPSQGPHARVGWVARVSMKWWFVVLCVGAWLLFASKGEPVARRDGVLGAAADVVRPFSGTGRVLSAEGMPVSGASVTLQSPEGDAWYERVVTNQDGGFSFEQPPARFRVLARHALGEVTSPVLDQTELVETRSDPLVLVLVAPVELTGSVVDGKGDAVAHAQLSLARVADPGSTAEERRPSAPQSWATSDDQGRFGLIAAAPGEYLVKVWAQGFVPREILVQLSGANAIERFELTQFADVRGVVVDPQGRPLANAVVLACEGATELTTAADGGFVLPVSSVGCTAIAHHPGFAASPAEAIRGGHALRLQLTPGGTIRGLVTDPSGRFAPGIEVDVTEYRPAEGAYGFPIERFSKTLRVIRDFRLGSLAPGTYSIRAFRQGDEDGNNAIAVDVEGIVVQAGATTRGVHLIVPAPESIE